MDFLPDELILAIFEHLSPEISPHAPHLLIGRTRELAKVCLVSRRFYRIARPILYRSIGCRPEYADELLPRLLAEYEKAPVLKQYMKIICHRAEVPAGWYEYMIDKFLLSIASQTPQLEQLRVRFPKEDGHLKDVSLLVREIGLAAFGDLPEVAAHSFGALRVLDLDVSNYNYSSAMVALPFLLLPNLRELSLNNWGREDANSLSWFTDEPDIFGHAWIWPNRTSPIEKLALLSPWMNPSVVSKILRACRSLKSFECTSPKGQVGVRDDKRVRIMPKWFSQIIEAVEEHSSTLEHLSLGGRVHHVFQHPNGEKLHSINSFDRLKTLRIRSHLLFSETGDPPMRDCIPRNIEHLTLDIHEEISPELDLYLFSILGACGQASHPYLKSILIKIRLNHFEIPLRDLKSVREKFREQQVRLDVMILCEASLFGIDAYHITPPSTEQLIRFQQELPEHFLYETRPRYIGAHGPWEPYLEAATFKDSRTRLEVWEEKQRGY